VKAGLSLRISCSNLKTTSFSFAAVEEIAYYEDRKLHKAQMPRFSTCKFVDEGHHIILIGASGNGKTYIACALGNAACRLSRRSAMSACRNFSTS